MLLLKMKTCPILNGNYVRLQTFLKLVLLKEKLPLKLIHSSCCIDSRKKTVSGYETVEPEKYSDLLRSITSSKIGSPNPDTLNEEDTFLFGKALKLKSLDSDAEAGMPKKWIPLVNPDKKIKLTENNDPGIPLKISLPARSMSAKIPSVTKILQQTMPMEHAFYLERWKQKMIMELGEEGFIEYTAAVFSNGKKFHASLEALLLSAEDNAHNKDGIDVSGYFSSVEHIMQDINGVKALESAVQHRTLHYGGLVDCVAEYRGQLCVIDWKTSEKQKPLLRNTFDNPLQVAAYVGAINHDENYNFQVPCGLIVVAYKDGTPAHPHFMDFELCSQYWNKWLLRLEEFMEKKENNPDSN